MKRLSCVTGGLFCIAQIWPTSTIICKSSDQPSLLIKVLIYIRLSWRLVVAEDAQNLFLCPQQAKKFILVNSQDL